MNYNQMFLGVWPREPFIVGEDMPDDTVVRAAVATILDYESPALALPNPPDARYYVQLVEATSYMMRELPLGVDEVGGDTHQNVHLRNLRFWAYKQAGHDATGLLQDWCAYAGIRTPVSAPENAIVLVRALRAEHLLLSAKEEKKLYLSAAVQECVALLEGMVGLQPTGSAADHARAYAHLDWQEDPWRQFVTWLMYQLPIGQLPR